MVDRPWSDGTFFTDGTGWFDAREDFERSVEYLSMRSASKEVIFGIEIDAYNPASDSVSRYRFGTRDLIGSVPIKYFVEGRVMTNFRIRRVIPFRDGRWGGLVELQIGSLELSNGDGGLDALAETAVDGRRVSVLFAVASRDLVGNSILPDFDTFVPIYTTVAEGWTFTEDRLRIKLKDPNAVFDEPIQSEVYKGVGQSEGHQELQDVLRPVNFGESKFVPPILVDPFELIYQVSTRPLADIDIFDGGVRVATTRANYGRGPEPGASLPDLKPPVRVNSYAALQAANLEPGGSAIWLQGGYFRLATAPIFVITAHCFERDPDTNQSSTIGSIIRSMLDTMKFTNFDANSLQVEPYTRRGGYYLEGGSTDTAAKVIDDLAWSIGGVFGASAIGKFTTFPIRDPVSATPVIIFGEDEIIELERLELPYGIPPHQWRVHYDRIWRPHSESEVTGFSEGYQDQVTSVIGAPSNDIVEVSLPVAEWRGIVTRESPNLKAIHQTSVPKETYSYVRSAADAAQSGETFLTLYTPGRKLFKIVVKTALFLLEPGQIVEIVASRWTLQDGMRGIIIEIEDDVGRDQTEIILFGGPSTIPPVAPQNRVLPTIGGTGKVNHVLQTSIGTWWAHPLPRYTFQWLRNGVAIPNAINQTYVPVIADVGSNTIRCRVTATNSEGSASALTATVSVSVPDIAPVNTVLPAISGTPRVRSTLTCSTGTWTGQPAPTFTFQWTRAGFDIAGATSSLYVPTVGDVGANVACRVRAENVAGHAVATSNPVTVVAEPVTTIAPVNTSRPVITGTPQVGSTLTCSLGTWTGSPTPTFTRQWLRSGAPLTGVTGATYTPASGDIDRNISCRVTATNSAGTASAVSDAVLIRTTITAPVNTSRPVISGTPIIGNTLTCSTGTWSGNPAPSFRYQWRGDGVDIRPATSSSYRLIDLDANEVMDCRVTATNSAGSASALSSNSMIARFPPNDFPAVASFFEQKFPDATNNHQVPMPATVVAGDLLMIFFAHRNDTQIIGWPDDWTTKGWSPKWLNLRNGPLKFTLLVKRAGGGEDGTTVNIRTERQRAAAAQVYRIQEWFGNVSTGVEVGPIGTAESFSPLAPPMTNPWAGVGSTPKVLWIAAGAAADDDAIFIGFPAGFIETKSTRSGAVAAIGADLGCSIGTARRNLQAGSIAPSNFSLDKSDFWIARMVAIRPAS